jgi:hypothetical protein
MNIGFTLELGCIVRFMAIQKIPEFFGIVPDKCPAHVALFWRTQTGWNTAQGKRMMSVDSKNPRQIFLVAVKLPSDQRESYLVEACAGDEPLRQRVAELLKSHEEIGSFLDAPPAVTDAFETPGSPQFGEGTQIGPYKLLQQIGEGGMSVVYMAEQQKPVRRRVALKIIKPGMDKPAGDCPLRGRAPGAGRDGPPEYCPGAGCRLHRKRPPLLCH